MASTFRSGGGLLSEVKVAIGTGGASAAAVALPQGATTTTAWAPFSGLPIFRGAVEYSGSGKTALLLVFRSHTSALRALAIAACSSSLPYDPQRPRPYTTPMIPARIDVPVRMGIAAAERRQPLLGNLDQFAELSSVCALIASPTVCAEPEVVPDDCRRNFAASRSGTLGPTLSKLTLTG
jgi:hypothetical protein